MSQKQTKKSPEAQVDAVKLMREIREQLSAEYLEHPEREAEDLAAIKKKYNIQKSTEV